MNHKHFGITLAKDNKEVPPSKLNTRTRLNNWKRIADTFYRGSEILFIQIDTDEKILIRNQELADQKKPVNWGYAPRLDALYCLQIGICLENMIKGLITHSNPSLVDQAKLPKFLKTHDLKELVSFIPNFVPTADESMLFEFLTTQIVWYSKYPIPLSVDKIISSARYNTEEIRNLFLIIYNKLSRLMEATGKLDWTYHGYEFSPNK